MKSRIKRLPKDRRAYHLGSDFQFEHSEIALGAISSYSLTHDPKHMAFVLARYKFCAKMLEGKKRVMEIGSGDGIGLPIVAQAVKHVCCVDWDERHIESIRRRLSGYIKNITLIHHDLNVKPLSVKVDAAFSIDVIEHIDPRKEAHFIQNIVSSLSPDGVLITGTPNIAASSYATACSRVQHINLKSMKTLRGLMEKYFQNVFMFGMNDEVLHTGYAPMCHFIWSVAAGLKNSKKR
jgi:2-polyprenyl-3-methyl-5-hydroxy-6-metoxy-1,4-benzoquinol methylase